MSKPIFYEGQQVGCLMFGEGFISSIHNKTLCVDFAECRRCFLLNGTWLEDTRPTLYPIDQYREIIANLPTPQPEAWKPKPGEWCWFWDNEYTCAVLNMLVSIEADKHFPYLTKTGTSYHNCAPFTGELPDHLKEVQP